MSAKGITRPKRKDMTKEGLKKSFIASLYYGLAKDRFTMNPYDEYVSLSMAVRERLIERWIETQQEYHKKNQKRVYYLSLEFLIGRLLDNNMLNLGIKQHAADALEDMEIDIATVANQEVDAGLGNGGLGRLAACFLDSMATLGIPAHGYGIRYDYGIFRQHIVNGEQVEAPDHWLINGNPWEFERPAQAVKVKFYGKAYMYHDDYGNLKAKWDDAKEIIAMPYDIPVPGYKNDVVNTLKLWSARSSSEFDLDYFNDGDYEKAVFDKMFSENISKVLYPNDKSSQGRELRLQQEYFFTAASIADILRRYKSDNSDIRKLHEKVAIQLNDTHPALAVAELMRVLIDQENLLWEEAWRIVVKTFGYTNHTLLPEALEKWSLSLFETVLPRHMQIVYEINARFLREVLNRHPNNSDLLRRVSIIDESGAKSVRMAFLAIVGSHSINGVSELHSRLIKDELFSDFYELYPERFNNKTNGITQRRWLKNSNPLLSDLITEAIGEKWVTNLNELKKLEPLAKDKAFVEKWQKIKKANKEVLVKLIEKEQGIKIASDSLFDVQVKRIHEYKRQSLLALYAIAEYLKIKKNPKMAVVPRTIIFGGKAAPGYAIAKLTIKMICRIADVINQDSDMKGKLNVVFLENYCVSLAEKIFPASDLSEQISTAGKEASGTGCMKFMINGALTIGTLDGANVEMAEEVGKENIFIFGMKSNEVSELLKNGYRPTDFIEKSETLKAVFQLFNNNYFTPTEIGALKPIIENLMYIDPFCVCADFESYLLVQNQVSECYLKPDEWTKKAILNVARSGKFSSDRTIAEYADEIWNVPHF
jgi:starch phosphorylase